MCVCVCVCLCCLWLSSAGNDRHGTVTIRRLKATYCCFISNVAAIFNFPLCCSLTRTHARTHTHTHTHTCASSLSAKISIKLHICKWTHTRPRNPSLVKPRGQRSASLQLINMLDTRSVCVCVCVLCVRQRGDFKYERLWICIYVRVDNLPGPVHYSPCGWACYQMECSHPWYSHS